MLTTRTIINFSFFARIFHRSLRNSMLRKRRLPAASRNNERTNERRNRPIFTKRRAILQLRLFPARFIHSSFISCRRLFFFRRGAVSPLPLPLPPPLTHAFVCGNVSPTFLKLTLFEEKFGERQPTWKTTIR